MNHQEVTVLTRYVKAMCPAQAVDDLTPDAWMDVLADLRSADCRAAIAAMKRGNNPPRFIDVADIRDAVRRLRNERIEKAPHYEPDSGLTELEWRRRAADCEPLPEPRGLKPRPVRQAIANTFPSPPPNGKPPDGLAAAAQAARDAIRTADHRKRQETA